MEVVGHCPRNKDCIALPMRIQHTEDELTEFQDLWIEKIRGMLFERKAIDEWIKIRS